MRVCVCDCVTFRRPAQEADLWDRLELDVDIRLRQSLWPLVRSLMDAKPLLADLEVREG